MASSPALIGVGIWSWWPSNSDVLRFTASLMRSPVWRDTSPKVRFSLACWRMRATSSASKGIVGLRRNTGALRPRRAPFHPVILLAEAEEGPQQLQPFRGGRRPHAPPVPGLSCRLGREARQQRASPIAKALDQVAEGPVPLQAGQGEIAGDTLAVELLSSIARGRIMGRPRSVTGRRRFQFAPQQLGPLPGRCLQGAADVAARSGPLDPQGAAVVPVEAVVVMLAGRDVASVESEHTGLVSADLSYADRTRDYA